MFCEGAQLEESAAVLDATISALALRSMNYVEQVLSIDCAQDQLIGVLALPERPHPTAVLVVVGGPQYRAGSHRQFVLLARRLASAGYVALRIDVRGMGDSGGAPGGFENLRDDIGAAIDGLLRRVPDLRSVVLWGLCDGASAALLYCHATRDPRVRGLCLANPWVRTQTSLARTHIKHHYTHRLRQRAFWFKLARGKIALKALRELWRNLHLARSGTGAAGHTYQQRMAAAWLQFDGELLLLLSGRDYTAKEFSETVASDTAWAGALQHPHLQMQQLAQADHTFSTESARQQAEALTVEWLDATLSRARPGVGPLREKVST